MSQVSNTTSPIGVSKQEEPSQQGSMVSSDNDFMREISGFLHEYEACVRDTYLSTPGDIPAAMVVATVEDEMEEALQTTGDTSPEAESVVGWKQYSIDQYLKDFDTIIETSREAQKNALGLANSLQGVFQSVMNERNQAIDDLKK